jgi:histidinol dehydrogenase
VSGADLDAAYQQVSQDLLTAIRQTCGHLEAFHRQRLPRAWVQFGQHEQAVARRYFPYQRAGLYVDGSNGSGIGSLLMQAIPARVAQVKQIAVAIAPEPDGRIPPTLLVAAQAAGIDEIYGMGGVGAIAAFAYGTATLPKVDVITGSGDINVTLAKKLLQGIVAIDHLIDNTDLMILADNFASAERLTLDLMAHIEQDPTAAILLLTTDLDLARQVQQQVSDRLPHHAQGILAEKAIAHQGLIVLLDSLAQGVALINHYVPQTTLLNLEDPWAITETIHSTGTILLGQHTPLVVSEYLGGGILTIPSRGKVRYPTQVDVETFLRSHYALDYSAPALNEVSQSLQRLTELEGRSDATATLQHRDFP